MIKNECCPRHPSFKRSKPAIPGAMICAERTIAKYRCEQVPKNASAARARQRSVALRNDLHQNDEANLKISVPGNLAGIA